MSLANVPAELKAWPNWVVWRYEKDDERPGKVRKRPCSPITKQYCGPDIKYASVWSDFAKACEAAQDSTFNGVGFVFTNTPYAGIDLDATDDPQLFAEHWRIVQELNSYTELSPSGKGAHIIVRGSVPRGTRSTSRAVEVYSEGRYFTVTGVLIDAIGAKPINSVNGNLANVIGITEADSVNSVADPINVGVVSLTSDEAIITQASVAANAEKFKALHSGDISGHNNDRSSADQAYVNMLCFYSQDDAQVARIWRASGLAREKLKRNDYVASTIRKGRDQQGFGVDFSMLRPRGQVPESPDDPQRPQAAMASSEIIVPQVEFSFPPGLVGDIAKYIYDSASYPNVQISLAGALGIMAGICGRHWNFGTSGLNLYILLLAPPSFGKSAAHEGVTALLNATEYEVPDVAKFDVSAHFASGPALYKTFAEFPSVVSRMGEIGHLLAKLCDSRMNETNEGLRRALLDIYGQSGANGRIGAIAHSDSKKNVGATKSPSFSIFGETVPEKFYKLVNEDSIGDGLIPRFLIIEVLNSKGQYNEYKNDGPPTVELTARFKQLCVESLRLFSTRVVRKVDIMSDAFELNRQFRAENDAKNELEDENIIPEMWGRATITTQKIAALIAIGVDCINPIITLEHYEWAKKMASEGVHCVERRKLKGELGDRNNATSQDAAVVTMLKRYLALKTFKKSFKIVPQEHANKIIQLSFMQNKLYGYPAFSDRRTQRAAVMAAVKDACNAGILSLLSMPGVGIQKYKINL